MGKKKPAPQYARIEQPFGCDPPIVHCPICGNASMKVEEDGGKANPCPHLAFIYVFDAGAYEYQSQDFQERIKELNDEDVGLDNFVDFLQRAGYDDKLLAIEITFGGMGCGPSWYTVVHGFDYSTLAEQE